MSQNNASIRIHFMDSARAVFMILGIPYHAALIYIPSVEWTVSAGYGSPLIAWISGIIHSFRMPAFFIVAGFFSALILLRRSPRVWFESRVERLGIPLVAAALLLNPLQMIIAAIANGESDLFTTWKEMLIQPGGHWIRHLWFLIVLLFLSGFMASFWTKIHEISTSEKTRRILTHRWAMAFLAAALVIWKMALVSFLYLTKISPDLLWQMLPWATAVALLPYFTIGALLMLNQDVFDRFTKVSIPSIFFAILFLTVYCLTWQIDSFAIKVIFAANEPLAALFASQVSFSLLRRYMNTPSAIIDRVVAYSFAIYLFHQPFVGIIGLVVSDIQMPSLVGFSLVVSATFLCSSVAASIIVRWPVTNLLFNGVPMKTGTHKRGK